MRNASDVPFAVHFSTQPYSRFGRRVGLFWRLAWVIHRILTRSNIDHVGVECDGAVVTGLYEGVLILPAATYQNSFQIVGTSTIEVPGYADFDQHRDSRPTPRVPVVLRLLTLGRVSSRDCVSVACDVLRDAGVPVPRNIVTARGLGKWLRDHPSGACPYCQTLPTTPSRCSRRSLAATA